MRTAALLNFCTAIEGTSLSIWIQDHGEWFVPMVQAIHILCISAILISTLMINARILGFGFSDRPLNLVIKRFSSAIYLALALLLLTGIAMIVGEPARSLANMAFQLKMLFLFIALSIFFLFTRTAAQDPHYWEKSNQLKFLAKLLALISIALWVGIVFAGRWIAYS
jgi:hypothetical protein